MSLSFGQYLSKWYSHNGSVWLYTIFTTDLQKSNQVMFFSEDEFLRNEFYKDIEYDEWFLERIHACFIQNPL